MKLEDSSGRVVEPASVSEIEGYIDRIGKDLDHCILSEGDEFIQCAGSGAGLLVEFGDAEGVHTGTGADLSGETVKELFSAFFEGDPSWKRRVETKLQGAGAGAAGGDVTEFEQKSLRDTVVDSVKREAQSSFSYMIRRLVRRLFRRVL